MSFALALLLACPGTQQTDSKVAEDPGTDVDEDGYIGVEYGGDDCWDDPTAIPDGYTAVTGEVQPEARDVHPDAVDYPYDGVDSDCAGNSDFDLDKDGVDADDQPKQDGSVGTDCNDQDANTYPGAEELTGDGADENCDGMELCYEDADGDLHGDAAGATVASDDVDCDDPGEANTTLALDDCDDGNAAVFPGATEGTADGIDQDCDGMEACVTDADGDGYGNNTGEVVLSTSMTCSLEGQVVNTEDCDDTNAAVYPYAYEYCDGLANDCTTADTWALTNEDGLVSFHDLNTGFWADVTSSFAAGTATTPASVTVPSPGNYGVCTGTWYAGFASTMIDFSAAAPEGHSATLSFNGKSGSVLSVVSANASFEHLDLVPGKGTEIGDGTYGGALYASDVTSGGYLVVLDDVMIPRGNGIDYGGAVAAMGTASVELRGSFIEGAGELGGAVYLEDGGFSCIADGEPDAGIWNSDADLKGGAVYLATDAGTFTSDGCDFDANTPDDIAGANGSWAAVLLSPSFDLSFTCTGAAGCTL